MSEKFGENLTFLRTLLKLKQAEMPDFIGISRATWSDYERGKTEPDFKALLRISEEFRISVDDLLKKDLKKEVIDVNLILDRITSNNREVVNLNVNPSVNLIGENDPNQAGKAILQKVSNQSGKTGEESLPAYQKAIDTLELLNSYLTRRVADLERDNSEKDDLIKRLKKELPQIGSGMEGAASDVA